MKILKRDPLLENIHKGLLKAYAHIPAELEQEKKRKEALKDKKWFKQKIPFSKPKKGFFYIKPILQELDLNSFESCDC